MNDKQKGMTLVSVMVGFALLLLGISLFYSAIQLSNKILATQKQRIENTEKLIDQYYLNENDATVTEEILKLENVNNHETIEIKVKKYTITNDAGELYYYGNE